MEALIIFLNTLQKQRTEQTFFQTNVAILIADFYIHVRIKTVDRYMENQIDKWNLKASVKIE